MRDVYVLGVGQTFFGRQPQYTVPELGAQASVAAFKDAGISPKEIERCYVGTVYGPPNTAQAILIRLGRNDIPSFDLENGCTSGSSAVDLLYREVALGGCEVGLAIGVESLSAFNAKFGKGLLTVEGDYGGELGLSTVSFFAGSAKRMMEERGATPADLAFASVKNHINGSKNPFAQYKKILTTEEILESNPVVDPLTAFMCCPQSDGAAALILCSKEYYDAHTKTSTRPAVRLAASVIKGSGAEDSTFDPLELPAMIDGAKEAYKIAGIGPEDLDLIELHDAFSSEELAVYEMLGLCPKGEGVAFARSGATEVGGKIPVNPSGGLLSMGHPLGASGVRVVNDVAKQLWGEASANQIEGAKVGMAQMLGGLNSISQISTIAGIQILKK